MPPSDMAHMSIKSNLISQITWVYFPRISIYNFTCSKLPLCSFQLGQSNELVVRSLRRRAHMGGVALAQHRPTAGGKDWNHE
jgi:hypothetical protein